MPLNRRCCCDCDTKEEAGMPDSLVASHSILTSDDEGMPADSGIGGGPYDCAPQYHYEFKTHILELLSSITYDYVAAGGSSCGACCYHYEGRGSYTPECPEMAGSDWILFGASHFLGKAIGEYFQTRISDGDEVPDPDPLEPYVGECCPEPTTLDCFTYCGQQGEWTNADMSIPQDIYGSADLYICVSGSVVTICETINFVIPCKTISGTSGEWLTQTGYGQTTPECDDPPHDNSAIVTSGGETEGCATTGATLTLTATGDLSMVSGANIWEKIINAPAGTFVSDYEFVACSCAGGGCAESDVIHTDCGIATNCNCPTPNSGVVSEVHEEEDVDIDCEYAVGTMELVLAEE